MKATVEQKLSIGYVGLDKVLLEGSSTCLGPPGRFRQNGAIYRIGHMTKYDFFKGGGSTKIFRQVVFFGIFGGRPALSFKDFDSRLAVLF